MATFNKNQDKLQTELKKMKNILMKKEKRLCKYNRVLSSRKHVRETVLKHQSEKTLGDTHDNQQEKKMEDSSTSINFISLKRKRSVTFQDNETFADLREDEVTHSTKELSPPNPTKISDANQRDDDKVFQGRIPEKKNDVQAPLIKFTNLKKRSIAECTSFQKSKTRASVKSEVVNASQGDIMQLSPPTVTAKTGDVQKQRSDEIFQDIELSGFSPLKTNVEKQPDDDTLVNIDTIKMNADGTLQPIKSRRKIKRTLGMCRKRPVKRLFSEMRECKGSKPSSINFENNITGSTIGSDLHSGTLSADPNKWVENGNGQNSTSEKSTHSASLLNQDLTSCLAAEETEISKTVILSGDDGFPYQTVANSPRSQSKQTKDFDTCKTEKSQEREISKVLKCESLTETNLGSICATSVSSCMDGCPSLLLIGTAGFSIWILIEENSSKKGATLVWKRSCIQETNLFKSLGSSHFCVLGGGSKQEVNFIIVQSPSNTGVLEIIVLHYSLLSKEVKDLRSSTSVSVCTNCTFRGCRSHPWDFYLYVQPCQNKECPNTNTAGVLLQTSFDLVYSHRTELWELVLFVNRRMQVNGSSLTAIKPLCYCDSNAGGSFEDQLVLWQDGSGFLGLTDGYKSLPISSSIPSLELQNMVKSGVLLYAAAVKEILLLILKTEEYCKFLAVNPLTGHFDAFYQLKLSEINMASKAVPSVIYYEKKFIFLTPDAVVFSLDIS